MMGVRVLEIMKKCTVCGAEKPLSEMAKNRSKKDGYDSCCKLCNRERQKIYREKNPGKYKEWFLNNKEKTNANKRKSYQRHRDKYLEKSKIYHANNPDVHKRANRKYIAKNRDELRVKNLQRYHATKDKNHDAIIKKSRLRYSENHDHCLDLARQNYMRHREKYVALLRVRRDQLTDGYIIDQLKQSNFINITKELIETKRQQILSKRILKQIKQWRCEHESDCGNV